MMGGWNGPTAAQRAEMEADMVSDYPRLKAKVAELERRLAMKDRIIGVFKDYVKKRFTPLGEENTLAELLVELLELDDD